MQTNNIVTVNQELTNDKAPGINKVLPNSFKSLNNDNLNHLLDFFNEYWMEKTDFDECHEGQIAPVPKSGYIPDTNKWISVSLIDIGAIVFCSILC